MISILMPLFNIAHYVYANMCAMLEHFINMLILSCKINYKKRFCWYLIPIISLLGLTGCSAEKISKNAIFDGDARLGIWSLNKEMSAKHLMSLSGVSDKRKFLIMSNFSGDREEYYVIKEDRILIIPDPNDMFEDEFKFVNYTYKITQPNILEISYYPPKAYYVKSRSLVFEGNCFYQTPKAYDFDVRFYYCRTDLIPKKFNIIE